MVPMRILGSTLGVAAAVILTAGTILPSGETRAGDVESLAERLDAAEARLERLRVRSDEATDELAAATDRLAELADAMDAASSEIERLAGRARRLDKRFARLARQLYIGGGVQPLESLLSARSLADMETRIQYLSGSQHAHLALVRAMRRERAELNAYLDDLDTARAEAEEIRTRALAVSHDLDRDVEAQRHAVAALQRELVQARERAADRRAARIRAALKRAQDASRRAAEGAEQVAQVAVEVSSPPAVPTESGIDWDAIAMCESSGNWQIDSRFDGGLQFDPDTWLLFGGGRYARYAYQASREQQIVVAERVLEAQGPEAWPNCFEYGRS